MAHRLWAFRNAEPCQNAHVIVHLGTSCAQPRLAAEGLSPQLPVGAGA